MIYSVYAVALSRTESFCISTAVISPGTFEIRFHCHRMRLLTEKRSEQCSFPQRLKIKAKKHLKYNTHVQDNQILKRVLGAFPALGSALYVLYMLSLIFFECLVCCRAYIFYDWIAKNFIDAAKPLPIISMLKYLQIINSIPAEKQIRCPPCHVEGWPPRSFVNTARHHDTFESELSSTSEC